MSYGTIIRPEDWDRSAISRVGVDKSEALRIRYIGSEVVGQVKTVTTSMDLTFEQGATAGTAVVGTGDNPGTTGVIDLTTFNTLFKVVQEINTTTDWEAWLEDVPGDYDPNLSAGNGLFAALSDVDCGGADGAAVLLDTSLHTAEDFYAGITYNGPSTDTHGTDHQTIHELLRITALATYGAGIETVSIYECDDDDGTKTLIGGPFACGATTVEKDIPSDIGEPICATKGKRISVLMANDTGAHTVTKLVLQRRSMIVGPAVRKSKLWSRQQG